MAMTTATMTSGAVSSNGRKGLPAPQVISFPGADVYKYSSIMDYQTPPDHNMAGAGILRRGASCLLVGGTGIGKSVLAEQISVSVAAGVSILGCVPVHGAFRVLHIQAENDAETMQRDFLAIASEVGADDSTLEENLTTMHAFGLTGAAFTEMLADFIPSNRPDLITIDPYQAFSGAIDMNGTQGFLEWIKPVQGLLQEYRCALLLVAHTPKPRERENWNPMESVYMVAGTSAISNWARTSLELCTIGQETDRFRLGFGKNAARNGLTSDCGGITRELYLQHSGSIHKPFWRVSGNQGRAMSGKYDKAITDYLRRDPDASVSDIADEVGCDRSTASRVRTKLRKKDV